MAESILTSVGAGRFHAYSAGCSRKAPANHYVIDFLAEHHMPVIGLGPKTLEGFLSPEAPRMDFIITLSGDAATSERLAEWPGEPFIAHWNIQHDERAADSAATQRDNFWTLMRRIKILASLPHGKLSRRRLQQRALTLEASYL
jgi:arsenate reductase